MEYQSCFFHSGFVISLICSSRDWLRAYRCLCMATVWEWFSTIFNALSFNLNVILNDNDDNNADNNNFRNLYCTELPILISTAQYNITDILLPRLYYNMLRIIYPPTLLISSSYQARCECSAHLRKVRLGYPSVKLHELSGMHLVHVPLSSCGHVLRISMRVNLHVV